MKPITSSLTSHAHNNASSTALLRQLSRLVRVLGIGICIYLACFWEQPRGADETITIKDQGTAVVVTPPPPTTTAPQITITPTTSTSSSLRHTSGSDAPKTTTNDKVPTASDNNPTTQINFKQDNAANLQVLYNPNPSLVQQDTYYFPVDKQPDPIPTSRVMAAFPPNSDPGQQAVFGTDDNNLCDVTSMMRITRNDMDPPSKDDPLWTLTTFNLQQQPKTVGGDEYYITYTAEGHTEPTAIGFVHDWNNGNYSFHFVSSPTAPPHQKIQELAKGSSGVLTVILEQSCGMGFLSPPLKNAWLTSGAINQNYTLPGIPAPKHIQKFVPPNANKRIDLSSFHEIAVVGGGLLGQFVCVDNDKPSPDHCGTFPGRNNIYRGAPTQVALHTQTMADPFFLRAHKDLQQATNIGLRRLQQGVVAKSKQQGVMREGELFPRDAQGKVIFSFNHLRTMQGLPDIVPSKEELRKTLKIALIIGSGVWDILADEQAAGGGQNFENHLMAAEQLILSIRESYPGIAIFWKSMTALHIHAVAGNQDWVHTKRVYYMSNSRARHLDRLQKDLMKKLNVPVLDVFDATYYAAHKTQPGDGRNYRPEFNQRMLAWFYK